jgi:hypothetical protein
MGDDPNREIPVVFVKMDEDNGVSVTREHIAVIPFWVIPSKKKIDHNGTKYVRYQLPLIPAHCQTIHSAQGLTAPNDLVIAPSPGTPFEMALEYVAISRVTKLSHLYTLEKFRPIHFSYKNSWRNLIRAEMERLNAKLG